MSDDSRILQEGISTIEAEAGLRCMQTPKGLGIYLSFIAMLPDGVPDDLSVRSWAQFNADNSQSSTSWNAYRDRYAYGCMLGEWRFTDSFGLSSAYRQRWFGSQVKVLSIAASPWEGRHAVNDIVRDEMEALGLAGASDASFAEFLRRCFQIMGHQIAGVPSAAYYRKLAAAQKSCPASADHELHALLRKESLYLRSVLMEQPHNERAVALHSVLASADALLQPCVL